MRVINIIGAAMVAICSLIVSYNHSIWLFSSGGYKNWMAHVAVIGCEVTFILGALNIVVARLKKVDPGLPAKAGGLLGALLVGWSNVSAGWGFGVTGILLGIIIPLSMIISEAILSYNILISKQPRTPLEWALEYYRRTNQVPKIKDVTKACKCSTNKARKAIHELKKQIESGQVPSQQDPQVIPLAPTRTRRRRRQTRSETQQTETQSEAQSN